MATTAQINITSDITESISFSINETMTMYQAGGRLDLEETTGLAQRTFSGNTTQVVLLDVSTFGAITNGGAVAHKVYIRNTTEDKTKGFKVFLADTTDDTEEIGTLYGGPGGGDWMLMPWLAADANEDIMVQPSSSDKMTIEYAVFHQ